MADDPVAAGADEPPVGAAQRHAPAAGERPADQPPRTAVLVIHGIGNQRPLETLRNAADAIYSADPAFGSAAGEPKLWLTFDRDDPDRDLDLPMLTTADIAAPGEPPHYVDFHECYWAHIMSETRFVAVPLWLFELVRKGPCLMQPGIRPLWPAITVAMNLWLAAFAFLLLTAAGWATGTDFGAIWGPGLVWLLALGASGLFAGRNGAAMMVAVALVSWALHVAGGAVLVLLALPAPAGVLPFAPASRADRWVALVMAAGFVLANTFVLLTVVGDAARYYRAAPANIAVRRAARKLAVDRLRALHHDGRYDRIVVVAHSLGTVIGYDMLRAYWSDMNDRLGDPGGRPDFAAQDRRGARGTPLDVAAWRGAKPALLAALDTLPRRDPGIRWMVSDFVTLGSPLTHARFLMADGTSPAAQRASFRRKRLERELPQDPAWHVGGDGALMFRLPGVDRSILHSGAMFGVTRWTNIFFPLRAAVLGDVVGGEVAGAFGPGVDDRPQPFGAFARTTAHIQYFNTSDPAAPHLTALRAAVDLRRTRWMSPVALRTGAPAH